ncbi:transporter [Cupriavidus basilensis]
MACGHRRLRVSAAYRRHLSDQRAWLALRAQALGDFKSKVYAVGPEVGCLFTVGGQQACLNLRGYKSKFGAQNRTEGYALFATVSIPIGSAKK